MIVDRVTELLAPGAVVLLHDGEEVELSRVDWSRASGGKAVDGGSDAPAVACSGTNKMIRANGAAMVAAQAGCLLLAGLALLLWVAAALAFPAVSQADRMTRSASR